MDFTPLRTRLCEELEHFNNKEITPTTLEHIDKLAHAIKCIDKIHKSNYDEPKKRGVVLDALYAMMENTNDDHAKEDLRRAIAELEK